MRPTSDLAKLYGSFAYRLLRVRRLYAASIAVGEPRGAELLAVSVMELDNLVLGSLRTLTISSLRGARTAQGARIRVDRPFGDEQEISAFILSVLAVTTFDRLRRPTRVSLREEPTVRDPRDTAKVLMACSASNLASFQNALALNTTLFSDLGTMRNFYAHRNADTWRKARAKGNDLGAFGATRIDDIVKHGLAGRPVTVLEDWMDDAELFFEEATK